MFVTDPSATTTSHPQSPDIAQLVGLLGHLMPLLLRFQSQAFQPQAFEQPFQGGPGNVAIPNPALDHQAAENLVRDIIAGSLRTLSAYLETNAGRHAGLENCVPIGNDPGNRSADSAAAGERAGPGGPDVIVSSLNWEAYHDRKFG